MNPVVDVSSYLTDGENDVVIEYYSVLSNVQLDRGIMRVTENASGWWNYDIDYLEFGPRQAKLVPFVEVRYDVVAPELSVTADPEVVFPADNKWRSIAFDIEAADDSGEVEVKLVDVRSGGHKAEAEIVSDDEARVLARNKAVYTFLFEATDPSGNVTTEEVVVKIGK